MFFDHFLQECAGACCFKRGHYKCHCITHCKRKRKYQVGGRASVPIWRDRAERKYVPRNGVVNHDHKGHRCTARKHRVNNTVVSYPLLCFIKITSSCMNRRDNVQKPPYSPATYQNPYICPRQFWSAGRYFIVSFNQLFFYACG